MTVSASGSRPAAETFADRVFAVLAHVVVRFRWLVVAAWIAIVVITSAAFPSLSSEVNNNNSQFLPASTPSVRAASLASPILVARTGSTVTSAGVILAGTFGVLGVVAGRSASGSQVRAIGFGLAIGILMDTFVVRTLLVPATVTLLGRWNWWPAAMSRRREPEPPSLEPPLVGRPRVTPDAAGG